MLSVAMPAYAALVTGIEGRVFMQGAGTSQWDQITEKEIQVAAGDKVRTSARSKATIKFEDGSRIELGPNGAFTLQATGTRKNSVFMRFGFMRVWVTKKINRRFLIRTPTAVCAVRGTEFSVGVNQAGMTRVTMFQGFLSVADNAGNEILLQDGQSINVTRDGLGSIRTGLDARSSEERRRDRLKREVGLEMTKEEVQAAAALEAKDAIFQEGKAIIDVNGNRVRIEEYIVRSQPNQFKLVVLNERVDRFDYFYYKGTFNTILPDDISVALRQLPGCIGAACRYFLTDFETARSNTIDNMKEVATGGHQVDVNNSGAGYNANGNPVDAVLGAFDPATDTFTDLNVPDATATVGNDSFYKTLFNTNVLTFNGVQHGGWKNKDDIDIQKTNTDRSNFADVTATTLKTPGNSGCGPPDCTYREAGLMHDVIYLSNAAGTTWEKYDSYIISNEGEIAKTSDFSGITSGTQYKRTLLNWNFQMIVTASEFQGRKIDLAVEPKIFIQSGLIP